MKLKKLNKILLIFFLIIIFIVGGVWSYLSSEHFAQIVSEQTSKQLLNVKGLKIAFKKIQPTLFPPGIAVNKINVNYVSENILVDFKSEDLDVVFNIFDFASNRISVSSIKVNHGSISVSSSDKTKTDMSVDQLAQDVSNKLDQLLVAAQELPVKIDSIRLESVDVIHSSMTLYINKLNSSVTQKSIVNDFEVDFMQGWIAEKINYLHGRVEVSTNEIRFSNIRAYSNDRNAVINGRYDFEKRDYRAQGRVDLNIKNIQNELLFADVGKIHGGTADIIFELHGNTSEFQVSSEIVCEKLISDFVNLDKISANLNYISNDSVKISNVHGVAASGSFKIIDEFKIYDFVLKEFIPTNVTLQMDNMEIQNLLAYVQDSLYPLHAKLTGAAKFILLKSGFVFSIDESVDINDLNVTFNTGSSAVKAKHLKMLTSTFELNGNTFYMNSNMSIGGEKLSYEGKIDSKQIAIVVIAEKINLSLFESFAYLKTKGDMGLNMSFTGTPMSTKMDASLKYTNLDVEGFYLGEGRSHVLLDFEKLQLIMPMLNGKVGVSQYSANANINLDKLFIHSSQINFKDSTFSDLLLFHAPVASKMNKYRDAVVGMMNVSYSVMGEMDVSKLHVKGTIGSDGLALYDEYLNAVQASFTYHNLYLEAGDVSLRKDNGAAKANMSYDLKQDHLRFNLIGGPFTLSRFNFYSKLPSKINSEASIDFQYSSKVSDLDYRIEVLLKNTKFENVTVADSALNLSYGKGVLSSKVDLFDEYKLNCKIDINGRVRSNCSGAIDTDSLELVLGGILGANIRQQDFDGSIVANGEFSFLYPNWQSLSTDLQLQNFLLRREDVSIVIDKQLSIKIANGKVEKLRESFLGNNAKLEFYFNGDLNDRYDFGIMTEFKASVLSLLSSRILKSSGTLKVAALLEEQEGKITPRVNLNSDDFEISLESVPFHIKKSKLETFFKDGVFHIKKFAAELDAGQLSANGSISLEIPYPNISLNYQLDQAKIILFDFADTVFSGRGSVTGSQIPYYLSGDIVLNRSIVRGLPDSMSNAAKQASNPYLPKSEAININSLLRLNIALKTQNPIVFINNLMDMSMGGDLLLQGSITNPRAQGVIHIIPKKSKVYFKNSEYVITRGDLLFNFDKAIENPEIDVIAQTNINNYIVKVRSFGPIDAINFDFSSDPPLSQQDILSLVAFGYTDDVSQRLSDIDRQNLSSIGVGQFLFGQLQINQRLKQSLGLELNLGTQFEMQSSSLLNARSSDGDGTGRVRSATKIQLKKQLSEEVELSVSSTLGGSIGQRQSMNLNYSINKNTSLEGIYEVKSNDEGEEDIIDKSIGADVKFRWSF